MSTLPVYGKALALALTFAASAGFAQNLTLGTSGPYSGPDAELGAASYNAVKLVVDAVNANGGVLGKQVAISKKDDLCDADKGREVGKAFVAEGVKFIMGHNCSGATMAAFEAYNPAGVIAVSPSATAPVLTQGKYPNFFRTVASDDQQGALQVDVLSKEGLNKIALINDDTAYGKGLAANVAAAAEGKGVEIAVRDEIPKGKDSYPDTVKKIVDGSVLAVVYSGNYLEAARVLNGLRAAGYTGKFLTGDGARTLDFIKTAGANAEGVLATASKDYSSIPAAQAALAKHQEVFGAPAGIFFLEAYAAADCLLKAINGAGSEDSAAVTAKLRSQVCQTTIGDVTFSANGNTAAAGFALYTVKDGKWVPSQL